MCSINKICVIGCGSVGEALLQLLCFKSLEFKLIFDIIEFVDPDIIMDSYDIEGQYPKVYRIEDQLININSNLNLNPIFHKYPDCFSNSILNLDKEKTLYIDCRDSLNQSSIFYMKIFSDGPYGHIIKYPRDNSIITNTNYKIKNSKYYSMLTVSKVIEDITNIKELEYTLNEKKYVINHLMKTL